MTMKFNIRNEKAKDIEQIHSILRAAFPTDLESKLVDLLRANGKAIISLVAVNGDEILGHILFSPVTTSPPSDAKGIGLAPVAVRPDVHSRMSVRLVYAINMGSMMSSWSSNFRTAAWQVWFNMLLNLPCLLFK